MILFLSPVLRKEILVRREYFKIKYNVYWCDKKFSRAFERLSNLTFKYSKFNYNIMIWNKMDLHKRKEFEI